MNIRQFNLFDSSFTRGWGLSINNIFENDENHSEAASAANDGHGGRELRKAERQLQALSDKELRDLGISRGEIPYVVRNGRPGIDTDPDTTPPSSSTRQVA